MAKPIAVDKVLPEIAADEVIDASDRNESNHPVRVARYLIEVVYNEAYPEDNESRQIRDLADEFQRALNDGYFANVRYDTLLFKVLRREVLHVAPAGNETPVHEEG